MDPATPKNVLRRLLPRPRSIEWTPGVCVLDHDARIDSSVGDPRIEAAIERWRTRLADRHLAPSPTRIRLAIDRELRHSQGYRLTIRRGEIELLGGSPSGVFYGLQTLAQLADFNAPDMPCCVIEDRPDFTTRGLLHDVTRGKVPTLDTLKLLADRLAALKGNQLQLYIEHAFTFAFDPDICGPEDGLTPHEIRELDVFCQDRFIDLVPAVATLGHMGRILSLPGYRHLAEIEPTTAWEKLSWPQRARGFTLDVANPESHRLVERMWGEILDAFSSPVVNICGDEPWDLGKGKNRDRFAAAGTGPPYIDHILRTHALCSARGRRTQVWSDVVRNHPELFHRLPRDLAVLHWGYDDKSDYDGTRAFVEGGRDTIVCPGTSGWKRILNAMNLAERNIKTFAEAGMHHGASGLINTDWGDHGHFNALACSWHGIALGAALGWDTGHPIGAEFDESFAHAVLDLPDPSTVGFLREASELADSCETWRMLWMPRAQVADDSTLPMIDQAEKAAVAARRCAAALETEKTGDPRDGDELILACRFTEGFAAKVLHLRAAGQALDTECQELSPRDLPALSNKFAESWTLRNKPSGLGDILGALARVDPDLRQTSI